MSLRKFLGALMVLPRTLTRNDGEVLDLDTGNNEPVDPTGNVAFDAPVYLSANVAGIIVVDGMNPAGSFDVQVPLYYPAGYTRPIRVTKVYETNTTATGITAHHNYGVSVLPAEE